MNLKKIKQILNNDIDKVLKALNIEYEIFSDNMYSRCPIHDNADNPRAFSYSVNKGIWKCWTRDCQLNYSNDVLGLIQGVLSKNTDKEVTFKDALNWSCKLLKINQSLLRDDHTNNVEIEEDKFSQLVKNIKNIYVKSESVPKKQILLNIDHQEPSTYFLQRGFKESTLRHFGVYDSQEDGTMKERAIIPIHDDCGDNIIGLIGRSIKEYRIPKFIISPKGFDKRFYFYNYHRAINKASETKCLYILEGQGDVWRMYEAGVHNAVGIFGKTLTDQQINKLYTMPVTHLIILTDNDQAGKESKVRIKRQLGRMYKLTFPTITGKDVGEMSVHTIHSNILSKMKGTY